MVQGAAQEALQSLTGDRYVNFKDVALSESAKKRIFKSLA
jgi:hypothetical protein